MAKRFPYPYAGGCPLCCNKAGCQLQFHYRHLNQDTEITPENPRPRRAHVGYTLSVNSATALTVPALDPDELTFEFMGDEWCYDDDHTANKITASPGSLTLGAADGCSDSCMIEMCFDGKVQHNYYEPPEDPGCDSGLEDGNLGHTWVSVYSRCYGTSGDFCPNFAVFPAYEFPRPSANTPLSICVGGRITDPYINCAGGSIDCTGGGDCTAYPCVNVQVVDICNAAWEPDCCGYPAP